MSIHSTSKPSGSSSERSIRPTASTPGEFSDPLFWFTQVSSMETVRSCSESTVSIIACSALESSAAAGEAIKKARAASSQRRNVIRKA